MSLFKMKAGILWVNPHLHYLCPLFSFDSCRACWEGKPLCVQSTAIQYSFFHTPTFCQASLIRGLLLAVAKLYLCPGLSFLLFSSLLFSPCSPFSAYNDGAQDRKNILCTQDRYFMQEDLEESAERKACQFKRSWLGDCSGLQDPHYGYSLGRPCILLRMNRVRWVSPKPVKQSTL